MGITERKTSIEKAMRCLLLVVRALFMLLLGLAIGPERESKAQAAAGTTTSVVSAVQEQSADTLKSFRRGIKLVRSDRGPEAVEVLTPFYRRDPSFPTNVRHGTVSYWLGRAYRQQDKQEQALAVWRSGLDTLRDEGRIDVQLTDAFVREVMDQRVVSEYARVQEAYMRLVERLDRSTFLTSLSDTERRCLRRHAQSLAVILPEGIQERTGLTVDSLSYDILVEPTPSAGETLVGWWRSQDPLPATGQNERLQEHLRRTNHAWDNYAENGQLDDRGKVYIRFGEPNKSGRARLDPSNEAGDASLDNYSLRDHELWTYDHIDEKAYYLFVEREKGHYRTGGINDLFPHRATVGLRGNSDAVVNHLNTIQSVLRQLAVYHADYSVRASEAFDAAVTARNKQEFGVEDDWKLPSSSFAEDIERRNRNEYRKTVQKRSERVPPSYSTVAEGIPDLPVQARSARFLTEEGETRLEVYWSLHPAALQWTDALRQQVGDVHELGDSRFLLMFSGVQEDPEHADELRRYRRYIVRASEKQDAILSPRTFETTIEDSVFHFAMQWGQHTFERDSDGGLDRKTILRRHTRREDSLRALSDDPGVLEMSDPQLLTVPNEQNAEAPSFEDAVPHPFDQVSSTQPLGLRFEVYHLRHNADDRARYTVSYTLEGNTSDDSFLGLFGGDETEQTTTESTVETSNHRTEELILLDTENFVGEESTPLTITVTVEDEVTGQAVTRTVDVTVLPE